jgi:hypothetical protein
MIKTVLSPFALASLFAGTLSTAIIVRFTHDRQGEHNERRLRPCAA